MKSTSYGLIARWTVCVFLMVACATVHRLGWTPAAHGAIPVWASDWVQLSRLIGKDLRDFQNRKIGSIESVMVVDRGRSSLLVVDVEGYVNAPKRALIPVGWRDILLGKDTGVLRMPMSKAQMAAMPDYDYPMPGLRGTVYEAPLEAAGEAGPQTRARIGERPGR